MRCTQSDYKRHTDLKKNNNLLQQEMETKVRYLKQITINQFAGKTIRETTGKKILIDKPHIIQRKHGNNFTAAFICLNAEKEFDRVNLEFLYLTLEKYGFDEKSIGCIRSTPNPWPQSKLMALM